MNSDQAKLIEVDYKRACISPHWLKLSSTEQESEIQVLLCYEQWRFPQIPNRTKTSFTN